MESNKKRSAKRKFGSVPSIAFMTTEELVARHIAQSANEPKKAKSEDNENGKEDFDNLVLMMLKPDSD